MNSTSNAARNEKVFRALSYLLVFLVMACIVLSVSSLLRNLVPHWRSGIIASLLLFIVIDRLYTYRHLRSLTPLTSEWAINVGAQWVLIVLLIRLLLSYANGLDAFRADLTRFARGYIADLLTPEFVVSLLLAFLVWYLAGRLLDLLEEIGLDQQLALQDNPPIIPAEAVSPHRQLVNLIFGLGIGLVILTALARLDLQSMASTTQGLPVVRFSRFSGSEAGALFYFVFALALLSLSRLLSLQTHWNRLRIPVSSGNLYRQWAIYSILFLVVLALVVSLLPAGDSLGFFSVIRTLFDFLATIIFFIAQVIISLVLLLFSVPMMLMGRRAPFDSPAPAPPPLPNLPAQPPVPVVENEVWAVLRSILLWGGLALILIFALIHFVRQHGGVRAALRNARITNWLLLAWQWLYRGAEKGREGLSRVLAEGWQSLLARLEKRPAPSRPGWMNPRSLDARQQVHFYYLAMVRRGQEQGIVRHPSQTPREYAQTLENSLPQASEDVEAITDAFVEARYSRREIDTHRANRVRETWGRIRRALQEKSKREQLARKKSG